MLTSILTVVLIELMNLPGTQTVFFTNRNGLFDAIPACWQNMTEEERRKLCSLFDKFTGSWSIDNVKEVMRLGLCYFNDIPKLRGCYFMTKEDFYIFFDPTTSAEPEDNNPTPNRRHWMLNRDFSGFSLVPSHLLDPYKANESRENAANLFCCMINFVASNHGFNTGGQLCPPPYLDVEVTDKQKELLNPTSRDVQMGAILDQCVGKKAERKISRRRLDIVQVNVNSYARILNGAAQLDNIQTFTQLADSMSTFSGER